MRVHVCVSALGQVVLECPRGPIVMREAVDLAAHHEEGEVCKRVQSCAFVWGVYVLGLRMYCQGRRERWCMCACECTSTRAGRAECPRRPVVMRETVILAVHHDEESCVWTVVLVY